MSITADDTGELYTNWFRRRPSQPVTDMQTLLSATPSTDGDVYIWMKERTTFQGAVQQSYGRTGPALYLDRQRPQAFRIARSICMSIIGLNEVQLVRA